MGERQPVLEDHFFRFEIPVPMMAPLAVRAPSAMSNCNTKKRACFQLRSPARNLPAAFRSAPSKSTVAPRSPFRVAAVLSVTEETFDAEVLGVRLLSVDMFS